MACFTGIVAHLIVGRKPEPYLAAVLESIADVCDYAVINDNSGLARSANSAIILRSRLALSRRLTFVHSSFVDFASARNACIDATPPKLTRAWGLFVDADEVHGEELASMAALLPALPDDIDAVDGYSRHFVGSFAWWMDIQRSRCFVRLSPQRRWAGKIHERLSNVRCRVALPAVWSQYGHVVTPREEAEKSRLYASLAQRGAAPTDAQVAGATPASVWSGLLRKANRFRGRHPDAIMPVLACLQRERATIFAEVDAIASQQSAIDRLCNAARQMNYARLIAWRAAEAKLRWHWPNGARYCAFSGGFRPRAAEIALQVDLAMDQLQTSR